MILLYIALGGAAGAVARYGIGGWIQERAGFGFPWGTLIVNLSGSLLIGFVMQLLAASRATPELRALLTVGLLGGFTTFSTFSYETLALLQTGDWMRGGLYAAGSLLLGIAAVYIGLMAATYVLHGGR